MVATPEFSITTEEPQADPIGQLWSPARVTMSWSPMGKLPPMSVQVSVVSPIRDQMTVEELRQAHLRAAHEVLSAALLSIEHPAHEHQRTRPATFVR